MIIDTLIVLYRMMPFSSISKAENSNFRKIKILIIFELDVMLVSLLQLHEANRK